MTLQFRRVARLQLCWLETRLRTGPEVDMTDYLKNAWYMLAWSEDVGADMIARGLLDTFLVFSDSRMA
jgi:hypothetical protein